MPARARTQFTEADDGPAPVLLEDLALAHRAAQAGPDDLFDNRLIRGDNLEVLRALGPEFAGRVMNIHPALIPAFCGKGYYGHHVHEAVLAAGVKLTGCTVHFADNEYDHGPIIVQKAVPVLDDDTPETLAARVFEMECEAYPEAIELFAAGRLVVEGRRVRVH